MSDVLRFKIDQNILKSALTGADIETIELFQEGEQVSTYRLKRMAAKFMTDDKGAYLPYKQALKVFDNLPAAEYGEGLTQFLQAMTEAAIPKANGTPSKSPSEAPSPEAAASPVGS